MRFSINNIIANIIIVSSAAVTGATGAVAAAEVNLGGHHGDMDQRVEEINSELAAGTPTSVYIEIAGRTHALADHESASVSNVTLVHYDEARFTAAYFAEAEPVPGIFAAGPETNR